MEELDNATAVSESAQTESAPGAPRWPALVLRSSRLWRTRLAHLVFLSWLLCGLLASHGLLGGLVAPLLVTEWWLGLLCFLVPMGSLLISLVFLADGFGREQSSLGWLVSELSLVVIYVVLFFAFGKTDDLVSYAGVTASLFWALLYLGLFMSLCARIADILAYQRQESLQEAARRSVIPPESKTARAPGRQD